MKYYTKIFGCQMNHSDAERISVYLEKLGLEESKADLPAEAIAKAGLIVFVTCSVRQSAENRVYGQIHNIRKHHPKKKIILTGCLAHRKDVQRRLKGKVDLFTEIKNFSKEFSEFAESIKNQVLRINKKSKILNTLYSIHDTKNDPCNDYLKIKPKYTNPHIAYIPIMTGCNNFCAYCVVPYARGREYSRPAENILKEVKSLVKKGCKEIVLLGQNVNSYRAIDKNSSSEALAKEDKLISFSKLLKLIEKIPGRFWLTFLTSHPKDMSDELIETIAKSKNICEYVSLPAQSGDDEILSKMNRKYTIAHYKKLIKKIRAAYLGTKSLSSNLSPKLPPAISTDIIVGFPGETKKQFENTAKLFREMKFDMAYTNQYSPRPETLAWKLKDSVSKKEKARREKVLTDILTKTALANNKKYIGKTVEVLVDRVLSSPRTRGSRKDGLDSRFRGNDNEDIGIKYQGHAKTQKKVVFFSNKKIPVGSFQKVRITKAKAFGLEGKSA